MELPKIVVSVRFGAVSIRDDVWSVMLDSTGVAITEFDLFAWLVLPIVDS